MNIPSADRLLALRELPQHLPRRRGKRVNLATLYRWIGRGVCRGSDRVRLPAVRIGGIYYVDPADLAGFMESLTAPTPASAVTPATRFAHEVAERRAEAAGL